MNPEQERLSIKEKVGYSVGDTASNLFFQTFILFITIFYTDVFGLSAVAVGWLLLVCRVGDGATDQGAEGGGQAVERALGGAAIRSAVGAAIGGLKVVAANGWFAARPSGTEDIYKIYAESFLGAEHLRRIQQEAQAIVAAALGGARS